MLPFKRVSNVKNSKPPVNERVFTLTRFTPSVNQSHSPMLLDTFFYTIPIKIGREYQNGLLVFVCESQAKMYSEALNIELECSYPEPCDSPIVVTQMSLSDMSYTAFYMCIAYAIIYNSMCEGSLREPTFEAFTSKNLYP